MAPADCSEGLGEKPIWRPTGTGDGVTFAATDLAQVTTSERPLIISVPRSPRRSARLGQGALVSVRARVQEYSAPYDDYVDLVDLCDGVTAVMGRPNVTSACMVDSDGARGCCVRRPRVPTWHVRHRQFNLLPKKTGLPFYASPRTSPRRVHGPNLSRLLRRVNAKSWGWNDT